MTASLAMTGAFHSGTGLYTSRSLVGTSASRRGLAIHKFFSDRYLHPTLEIISRKHDIPPNANPFPAVLSSPLHNASPSDPRVNKRKIFAGSGSFRIHIRISISLRFLPSNSIARPFSPALPNQPQHCLPSWVPNPFPSMTRVSTTTYPRSRRISKA
jgi:hypothetical protein